MLNGNIGAYQWIKLWDVDLILSVLLSKIVCFDVAVDTSFSGKTVEYTASYILSCNDSSMYVTII